ncbi:biotin--[acetyl-CoA-carboxylase] ligase, partial [Candidatus Margulisiibacteriota bacterium]
QTRGRGRSGRIWYSPRSGGNAFFSIILKPENLQGNFMVIANITQYASLVLIDVLDIYLADLKEYGVVPKIKWPNDILINGLKVAGILAEAVFSGNFLEAYILGMGVNLNMPFAKLRKIDKPAGSLNGFLNKDVDVDIFLKRYLHHFFSGFDKFMTHGFPFIKEKYLKRSELISKKVSINDYRTIQQGKVVDFTEKGSLLLQKNDGQTIKINSGEVIHW